MESDFNKVNAQKQKNYSGARQHAATLLVCLALAFAAITVVSKCSFLYAFNDWTDVNWFISMGRGILDGKVPYKDLFEQKGVLIYMIFALACLIDDGYLGIYLIEILFAAAYLAAAYNILRLFKSRLYSLFALVPVAALTYCCAAFALGGGAVEEYCLPMLAYGLYVFLAYIKRGGDKIPCVQVALCGIFSGCIFWMKYVLLAFYGAFAVCVFADRCIKGEVKSGILYALIFVCGFAAACLPWVCYLAANGALGDMWQVYFIKNIFSYAGSKSFAQVAHDFGNTVANILKNILVYVLALSAAVYVIRADIAKRYKVYHMVIFAALFIIQCVIYGSHLYYHLAMAVYVPLGIAGAADCLGAVYSLVKSKVSAARSHLAVRRGGRYGKTIFRQEYSRCTYKIERAEMAVYRAYEGGKLRFTAVCAAVFIAVLLVFGNCTLELGYTRSDYPQLKIAARISDDADGSYTLLCYKIRDYGFYTACGISPDYYYFALNNFTREAFPALYEGQENYVINAQADYVVTEYSVWQEEAEGNLSAYRQLDSGVTYAYTHIENNTEYEYLEFVLLVAA